MNIFNYKSPNFDKLKKFGFALNGTSYSYTAEILDGQFEMRVEISEKSGEVHTHVIDLATGEPYTLHLVSDAGGAFVGAVRAEYERVLDEISRNCFENDVFKGDIAHKVIDYVRIKYGAELEFLWQKFPSNAIWRRQDNQKWYGIMATLSKRKLGLEEDGQTCAVILRIDPKILPDVVDGKKYFAGYHMNKKSWFTICLDGSVEAEEICSWIDKSYQLAKKS